MILAGLVANGETEIGEVYHIDRGYTNIEEKFKVVEADLVEAEEVVKKYINDGIEVIVQAEKFQNKADAKLNR